MATPDLKVIHEEATTLVEKSGWLLSREEWEQFTVDDFGLGDICKEGFAFVDILRSERLRVTIMVLLPNQTLPQHTHPPYEGEKGKEETLRVLYGQAKLYVPGPENNPSIRIPEGKETYYTARHEIVLEQGEQFTFKPNREHWFQAGPDGVVLQAYQNRVDETLNFFTDPVSHGCPIKLTD